jgi:hypothetical protein
MPNIGVEKPCVDYLQVKEDSCSSGGPMALAFRDSVPSNFLATSSGQSNGDNRLSPRQSELAAVPV